MEKINEAKASAKKITVDVDVQNVSGHQFYQALFRILLVYDNMTNIAVRINPQTNKFSDEAFLISSHYDSAHTSPGCHDDGLPTSIMLEILRNVIAGTNDGTIELHHPLIFLFNGAEEIFMCAAHGFVHQHPWAKSIKTFINLESAGSGPVPILFQASNSWITKEYAKVAPYPSGQVTAQDLFMTNTIPSDTDYRVYVDEGNMTGLDVAFFKFGQRYHTHMDSFENYAAGSAQAMGENAFAMVKHMITMKQAYPTDTKDTKQIAVFFDFYMYFMVAMNLDTATMINYTTLVISVALLFTRRSTITLGALLSAPLLLIGAVIGPIVAALILMAADRTMSYYQNAQYPLILFGAPCLIGMLLQIYIHSRMFHVTHKSAANSVWILNVFALALMNHVGLGSAITPLYYVVGFCLSSFIEDYSMDVATIIRILPASQIARALWLSLDLFVPITGRIGELPGDIIVGALTGFFTWVTILPAYPYLFKGNKLLLKRSVFVVLSAISLGSILLSILVLKPYSRTMPKRLAVQHVYYYEHKAGTISDTLNITTQFDAVNSYMGCTGMDPIEELPVITKDQFNYDHNHSHPVFVLPTFSMAPPIKRTHGWYSFNTHDTEHADLDHDEIIHPFVTLKYDQKNNKTRLLVDGSDPRMAPVFSTELNIYSTKPLFTSFGELGPRIDRVITSTNETLYCHKWFHFRGAASTADDKKMNIWFASEETESFHGIQRIEILTVITQENYFTKALNETVSKLPEWVAAGPAVLSMLDIFVKENPKYGAYELPDLLLSVYQ